MTRDLIVFFAGLFGIWALTASWGWIAMEITMQAVNNNIDFSFIEVERASRSVSKNDLWR